MDSLRRDINTFPPGGSLIISLVFVIGEQQLATTAQREFQRDVLIVTMHSCIPFTVYAYFQDIDILVYVSYVTGSHDHYHLINMGSSYLAYGF